MSGPDSRGGDISRRAESHGSADVPASPGRDRPDERVSQTLRHRALYGRTPRRASVPVFVRISSSAEEIRHRENPTVLPPQSDSAVGFMGSVVPGV